MEDRIVFAPPPAGQNLSGRLELTVSNVSRGLRLGDIAVELWAYEEIRRKPHQYWQPFMHSKVAFQGSSSGTPLPPSAAVNGPRAANGTWLARKGKTAFPFSFQIPMDAPSSYGRAVSAIRYVVTGCVQYSYNDNDVVEMMFKSRDASVVENVFARVRAPIPIEKPVTCRCGQVYIEGLIQQSGLCTSGSEVFIQVLVRNGGAERKVQITHAVLLQRVKIKNKGSEAVLYDQIANEQVLRDPEFTFEKGEERTCLITLSVPNYLRTIKNASLTEVQCIVAIRIEGKGILPFFNEHICTLEIPVEIYHTASIAPPDQSDVKLIYHPRQYNLMDPHHVESLINKVGTLDIQSKPKINKFKRGPYNYDSFVESSPPGRSLPWKKDAPINEPLAEEYKSQDQVQNTLPLPYNNFKVPNPGPAEPTIYFDEDERQGPYCLSPSPTLHHSMKVASRSPSPNPYHYSNALGLSYLSRPKSCSPKSSPQGRNYTMQVESSLYQQLHLETESRNTPRHDSDNVSLMVDALDLSTPLSTNRPGIEAPNVPIRPAKRLPPRPVKVKDATQIKTEKLLKSNRALTYAVKNANSPIKLPVRVSSLSRVSSVAVP